MPARETPALHPKASYAAVVLILCSTAAAFAGDVHPATSRRSGLTRTLSQPSALAPVRSSPFQPSPPSDSRFVIDTSAGLDTGCTWREGGPLTFTIEVTRVVGKLNASGTLANPDVLVANGVISPFALLEMPVWDVDADGDPTDPSVPPERDRIHFNGQDIDPSGSPTYLTGQNNIWKKNEFQVPISLIHFATRNIGSAPTPGLNVITIDIDVRNGGWCTAVDWAALSFKALAPVIMIHGNTQSGLFFGPRTPGDGPYGSTFIAPFKSALVQYDNSIDMTNDTIASHGVLLAQRIPALAAEFGAHHAHVVAHSKGGLDVRDALARLSSQNSQPPGEAPSPTPFGVLSLTTLATPHHGSAGADYLIDAGNASVAMSDDPLGTLAAAFAAAWEKPDPKARPDLRTGSVAQFNLENCLPRSFQVDGDTSPVGYFSLGADARFTDDGHPELHSFTSDEAAGSNKSALVCGLAYSVLGSVASTTTQTVDNVITVDGIPVVIQVLAVRITPTPSFQLNDLLVTVNSSRLIGEPSFSAGDGFKELPSGSLSPPDNQPQSKALNHATIANPAIGTIVLNNIRAVQPVK